MSDLTVGIIGSGNMAGRRTQAFLNLDGVRVTAVAARNPDTGNALASSHGLELLSDWRDLIARNDLDAVVVTTHNQLHGEICLAFLDAGKHVFTEYPVVRTMQEADDLKQRLEGETPVLSVAHGETVDPEHRALRSAASALGQPLLATFSRLTPGTGARPEVLFNLALSGPPALFFVYHVYALVDLFGPAAWVDCGASYVGLNDGAYERFANSLTVGFQRGGCASWNWAGGIEIERAEQAMRIVMENGTLIEDSDGWMLSERDRTSRVEVGKIAVESLEQRFVRACRGENDSWRADTLTALHAARIGIAAEVAADEGRRVTL